MKRWWNRLRQKSPRFEDECANVVRDLVGDGYQVRVVASEISRDKFQDAVKVVITGIARPKHSERETA